MTASLNDVATAIFRRSGTCILEVFGSRSGVCGRFDAQTLRFLLREEETAQHSVSQKRHLKDIESVVPRLCRHRQYLGRLITMNAENQTFTMDVVEDARTPCKKRYVARIEQSSRKNGSGWIIRLWRKPDLTFVPQQVASRSFLKVFRQHCRTMFLDLQRCCCFCCCCNENISTDSNRQNDAPKETDALLSATVRTVFPDKKSAANVQDALQTTKVPDQVFLLLPASKIKNHIETMNRKQKEIREKTRSLRMKNIPQYLHEQFN